MLPATSMTCWSIPANMAVHRFAASFSFLDDGLQRWWCGVVDHLSNECVPFSTNDDIGPNCVIQSLDQIWIAMVTPTTKDFLSGKKAIIAIKQYCQNHLWKPVGTDIFWLLHLIILRSQRDATVLPGSHRCWVELAGTWVPTVCIGPMGTLTSSLASEALEPPPVNYSFTQQKEGMFCPDFKYQRHYDTINNGLYKSKT